jgi:glycosidase
MRKTFSLLAFLLTALVGSMSAQVVSCTPAFPLASDSVEIIFNAALGNAALNNNPGPIYAHTGVVTNLSATGTSWLYVQGNWGTADPQVLMTSLGNNLWRIKYHMRNFYGVPLTETILKMGFVFRNASGSIVGRNTDGSDIFYNVAQNNLLNIQFNTPAVNSLVASQGSPINVSATASGTAALSLTDNGTTVTSTNGTTLTHTLIAGSAGNHQVIVIADDGSTIARDTFHYAVNPAVTVQALPAGTLRGLNRVSATTMRLVLDAPGKASVYILCDNNNYIADTAYFMKKTPDGNTFWKDITVAPGQVMTYQYLVNGALKVADPFSELVLDPSNDQWVTPSVFPNMPAYPTGKTTSIVSVLDADGTPYTWQVPNFVKPASNKLVVYELLVRDFINNHDYATMLDTLDYLQRLGVNAIEFMPLNEFEGNESWGYNPSFHMALDKYYGPADRLKALIDACHQRGIAVILDIAFNHAFSQSPLCQLYWDANNFKPTPDNPWLNPDARHPFNVGYDFNHESPWTKRAFTRTMRYWLSEFKMDGFRFDLSKGFTQTNSGSNVGLWGNFDQSRIDIWDDYKDSLRMTDPTCYLILEHFADNSEETALSNMSFLLWGNHNYNYNEATMGFIGSSNFEWINYQRRGWSNPAVVGFMESHDEERLMFKNITFGNSNGNYNTRALTTALARMELAANLFFPVPGPKMIWQFGERGYDISIDDPCRVCNKPPHWEYMNVAERQRLYKVYAALIDLKTSLPAFTTTSFSDDFGGGVKRLWLNHASMDVLVLGNFDVSTITFNADFQHTGRWYELWSGDSLDVTNTAMQYTLGAGEYRFYTTTRLPKPNLDFVLEAEDALAIQNGLHVWPNPTSERIQFTYDLPESGTATVGLYDLSGRQVRTIPAGFQDMGLHQMAFDMSDLPAGNYILRVQHGSGTLSRPVLKN